MEKDKIDSLLKKITMQWDKTEKLLKKSENLRIEVNLAAINELRYAGRRLADAMNLYFDKQQFDEHKFLMYISEAESFCFRAQHDSVDSIVLFLRERLKTLENEFSIIAVAKHVKNYTNIKAKLRDLCLTVENSREKRGERYDIYDKIAQDDIDPIIECLSQIEANEELLKKENTKEKWIKWSLIIAVITLFLTTVSTLTGLMPIFSK